MHNELEITTSQQSGINSPVSDVKGRSNSLTVFWLYMISPFAALLLAMKNYKASWAKNVVWFFVVFYGFTFVILSEGMDSYSYSLRVVNLHNQSIPLNEIVSELYSEDGGHVDVVTILIQYTVSRFTADHRVLFAVFGFVFGFFYSRNIWYLIDIAEPYMSKINILIIITFALIIGFYQINGFRMWTAAHIFFYGGIQFIHGGKRKGFIIAASSILVHFSFMFPVFLLLGYSFLKNRIHIYYMIFVASFFIGELDLAMVRETLYNYLPGVFHNRVRQYTIDRSVIGDFADASPGRSWHARYYGRALHWSIFILLNFIYYRGLDYVKTNKPLLSLLGFSFLFLGITSIVSSIPSVGRFVNVANLFAVAAIFIYLQYKSQDNWFNGLKYLIVPALLFFCIVSLRRGFETMGVMAIIGNPVIAIFGNIDTAIIELIKSLI